MAEQIVTIFNDDDDFLQWVCENFTVKDLLNGSKFLSIARSAYAQPRAIDLASEFEVSEGEVLTLLNLNLKNEE